MAFLTNQTLPPNPRKHAQNIHPKRKFKTQFHAGQQALPREVAMEVMMFFTKLEYQLLENAQPLLEVQLAPKDFVPMGPVPVSLLQYVPNMAKSDTCRILGLPIGLDDGLVVSSSPWSWWWRYCGRIGRAVRA